jgi:hypothetical protein
MVLFGFLEHAIPQTGYWTILVVFLLEQIYIFFRIWIKATFYGTQTVLFQRISTEQHASLIDAAAAAV